LWLSQVARVAADYCLRAFVVLELARTQASAGESAWHLTTALLMLPAVLFSPFNGALSNSLPKPLVLTGTALFCASAVAAFATLGAGWAVCWFLVAIGGAVYSPTRYALLPAASEDTGVPLTRVNGLIEMGAVTAAVAGLSLGARVDPWHWWGLPAAVVLVVGLNLFAAVTALPVWFRADVRRPDAAGEAVVGFFRDARRILDDREARSSLLALASLRGLVVGTLGAVLALTLNGRGFPIEQLLGVGAWVMIGVAAGSLLAGLQRHPRRALGLVPVGCTGLVLGLVVAAAGSVPSPGLCVALGVMGGLVNVPLAATYQASLPADARGNGMAVRNLADYVAMALAAGGLFALSASGWVSPAGQLWLLAALAALIALVSWRVLFRPFMEQLMELLLWPVYRIHGYGPGLEHIPRLGPLLVLANHSAWFDPLWLAKVVPRRVTPMMTSLFYDLPGLRWLMRYVVEAIRVQHSRFRREAPELQEAIAALDRGQCVIIFPEGSMRRKADKPLRQFGQGVWRILKERPQTPVVVCWIEGGWGSYFSYYNGPPTKNKRIDFWRRIDVAVGPVQTVDPVLLQDQRATRGFLMAVCLETRRYLGLTEIAAESIEPETAPADGEAPA
jgi:1-acyl-sn-glycerol-3-phosphate acyltransferase